MVNAFLTTVILTIQEHGSAAAEHKGSLLDVNPGLIFWTAVTFLILLFILKKTAWKPILSALDEREKKIEDALSSAAKARDEAQKLIQQNEANQIKAQEEAKLLIEQTRNEVAKLRDKLISDAHEDAKKLKEEASAEIDRKTSEAFDSLKSSIAGLAVDAAEKILKERLDPESNNKIVNQYLNEIKKN